MPTATKRTATSKKPATITTRHDRRPASAPVVGKKGTWTKTPVPAIDLAALKRQHEPSYSKDFVITVATVSALLAASVTINVAVWIVS